MPLAVSPVINFVSIEFLILKNFNIPTFHINDFFTNKLNEIRPIISVPLIAMD